MKLSSQSFSDGAPIPAEVAFGIPDPELHISFGPNRNPHLSWADVPEGSASFAVICHDYDVPTMPDDVNQEGREVPADLPRADFIHWVAVDIPSSAREIEAGEFAEGVIPRGRDAQQGPYGTRQGRNDYTSWFAGDDAMEGDYYGYDGPCPPWNDTLIHHYVFTLYALDIERCDVADGFDASEARAAMEGHILAEASITGTYALNPRLLA